MHRLRAVDRQSEKGVIALADERLLQDLFDLQWHLEELLPEGPATLVIDLSRVSRLSSTTICVLLRTRRRLCARGGQVILRGLRRDNHDALERTGLSPLFMIEPS